MTHTSPAAHRQGQNNGSVRRGVGPQEPDGRTIIMADEKLSYEQARAELTEVVAKLESGGVPLAESMQLWKRGEELAAHCQAELDGARRLIEEARRRTQAAVSDAGEQQGEDAPGR